MRVDPRVKHDRFKHRNFNNEPHIHISCGKKKTKNPCFL